MLTTWRMMLSCCALAVATVALAEGTPTGNRLLMDDSLAGWDHSPTPPTNWVISNGQLTGHADSTPLLSGWTVGDFDLRFQWSVRDGGAWTLGLPDVPSGGGLQIAFAEGEGSGAVREGDKTLAVGAKVDPTADSKSHSAEVRRAGSRLTVLIDGRVVSEVEIDRNRRFGLSLAGWNAVISGGLALLVAARLAQRANKSIRFEK